jgi:hypothetical protein
MGRSMATTSSQRQLFLAMVWTVTTALVAGAIQIFGVDQAFGDDGEPALAGIAVEYPLSGPDPADLDTPSALYAGLMWSVVETRVTPANGFMGRAAVEVDLEITNTLTLTPLRASENILSLVSADGNGVAETHFQDAGAHLSLEPGQTRSVTIAYKVGFTPNPDPATLSLRIGEPSRTPALIPLSGPQAPLPSTIFAAVATEARALADPDDSGRQIVVTPSAASIDINAGPYRARDGERLAVIKVDLQRTEVSEDSRFLTPDYWSLESSAGTVAPVLVARSPEAPATNADEVTLVFAFPADAQNLNVVAAPDAEAVRFPLVLPAG